jgi:hypothetical protein
MRDHELPNFAHHLVHTYGSADDGACDLMLTTLKMDGYREIGRQCSVNCELSCLDYFSALMYLHRTYLVEALTRYPEDPLSCKWGVSVYAVHRSALIVMLSLRRFYEQYPTMIPRVLNIWMHVSDTPLLRRFLSDSHRAECFRICLSLCHRDSIPWMSLVAIFTSRDR